MPRSGRTLLKGVAFVVLLVAAALITWLERSPGPGVPQRTEPGRRAGASRSPIAPPVEIARDRSSLLDAIEGRARDVGVEGEGTVEAILRDDREGSRHQRFIVRIDDRRTVLVAHNIDLAPRVPSLRRGDPVAFRGEYVWNEKGGVVHWTHLDPDGSHEAGWVRHDGRTFQ